MRLTINDIHWSDISKNRSQLMGLAILFVLLFHVGLPREDAFWGLRRIGNIGVDIFLFLSGIGLWFSWTKTPNLLKFYSRRFLRIYPVWLILSMAYYVPDYLSPNLVQHKGNSTSLIDMIGDITINWGFWQNGELTFWYIPAIMSLYLLSPFYMKLILNYPTYRWLAIVMIIWCILVELVTPINSILGHLEIFWSRIPIFFIGINIGNLVKRKETIAGSSIWIILILFFMTLGSSIFIEQERHGQFPLFLERMLYIPLTVSTILLLNILFTVIPKFVNKVLVFIGTLSLEMYLIHLHFVLIYIEPLHLNYWSTFVITLFITLPIAWIVHKVIQLCISLIRHIL